MNLNKMLAKVFGSSNEREVKRLRPIVERVNVLEPAVKKLSDEELRRTTPEFREKLYQILGEDPARMVREQAKKGALLDDLAVKMTDRGNVARDAKWMTNVPGVFTAGDMQRGQSLIVWAIAEGRSAAKAIDEHLMGVSKLPAPLS